MPSEWKREQKDLTKNTSDIELFQIQLSFFKQRKRHAFKHSKKIHQSPQFPPKSTYYHPIPHFPLKFIAISSPCLDEKSGVEKQTYDVTPLTFYSSRSLFFFSTKGVIIKFGVVNFMTKSAFQSVLPLLRMLYLRPSEQGFYHPNIKDCK